MYLLNYIYGGLYNMSSGEEQNFVNEGLPLYLSIPAVLVQK